MKRTDLLLERIKEVLESKRPEIDCDRDLESINLVVLFERNGIGIRRVLFRKESDCRL